MAKNRLTAALEQMKSGALVAITGDHHCNDSVALFPAEFTTDHGQIITPSKIQQFISRCWNNYWDDIAWRKRKTRLPVVAVFNGELADMNRHTKTGLITHSPADAKRIALAAFAPALAVADVVFVCRGTEAHAGEDSHMDEELAWEMNAVRIVPDEPRARWLHLLEVGGVLFDVAHHPGTGHAAPWTRGNDANKLAFITRQTYVEAGIRPPDIVMRGHTHKYADSGRNHRTLAIIGRPWKATDAYAQKFGSRPLPLPVGGAAFVCQDGRYEHIDYRYDWPAERVRIWTPDLMIPFGQT